MCRLAGRLCVSLVVCGSLSTKFEADRGTSVEASEGDGEVGCDPLRSVLGEEAAAKRGQHHRDVLRVRRETLRMCLGDRHSVVAYGPRDFNVNADGRDEPVSVARASEDGRDRRWVSWSQLTR